MKKFLALSIVFTAVLLLGGCSGNALLKRGHRQFDKFAYRQAIETYQAAFKKSAKDEKSIQNIADCYRKINDSQSAESWLLRVIKQKHDPIFKLYLGQALMQNEKYSEAVKYLEEYKRAEPGDQRTDRLIYSCNNYKEFHRNQSLYEIKNVAINTPYSDFGPAFHGEKKIIFSSGRREGKFKFRWSDTHFLDLYESRYSGSGTLTEPQVLGRGINTDFHEAITATLPEGDVMYFTRNNYHKGRLGTDEEDVVRLKIYEARWNGKKWQKVGDFPFNSDEYSIGHPALTADGQRMYFSSDMKGGHGGVDLYFSDRTKDGWGKPVNLGPKVNTEGDELFPWVNSRGELFFASNGHKGMGGLDIYRSTMGRAGFEMPENLGFPVNSAFDDFQLIYDDARQVGFFTSNRPGGQGDDDIYSFHRKLRVKGQVVDAKTRKPLGDADVIVMDVNENKTLEFSDEAGEWVTGLKAGSQYMINVRKYGYKPTRMKYSTQGKSGDVRDPVVIELEPEDICAATDLKLVGKVQDKNGNLPEGTRITVVTKEIEVTVDKNGNFMLPLQPGTEYEVYAASDSFPRQKLEVSTKGMTGTGEVPANIIFDSGVGEVFFIIYYNYDKHNIRNDASSELERVVKYMQKFPYLTVELSSHTDARGSKQYNEELSKSRAVEAYEYITSRGVAKDRLTYKWFGETQLTNDCADGKECDDEAHQLNRRTEFKLTGRNYGIKDQIRTKEKMDLNKN